jgi:hypothetical protein
MIRHSATAGTALPPKSSRSIGGDPKLRAGTPAQRSDALRRGGAESGLQHAGAKVAATKTAGVLGDDLALNAQQVAGVRADRSCRLLDPHGEATQYARPGPRARSLAPSIEWPPARCAGRRGERPVPGSGDLDSVAGAALAWFVPLLADAVLGMVAGAITYGTVRLARHV